MKQKNISIGGVICLLLFSSVFFTGAMVSAKEQMTIRVGYSNSEFLYAGSKNAYAGYGYELLQMIAQYEPVKYQYVYANSKELYRMLEEGKIDLLAPVDKEKAFEEKFDFTDLSIGSSQMVICANGNSDLADRLTEERIAIGMVEGTVVDKKLFKKYCKENHINALLVPYSSFGMMKDAMNNKTIDAAFAERWDLNNCQFLARFGSKDMYFMVKKGNNELLEYLNEGLERIEADSPEYQKMLYEKYYARHDITGTILTSEEKKFVEKLDTVRVAVPGNMAPLQQENENGKFSGIHMDILNVISEKTGLVFTYANTGSLNQAVSAVKEGKADMICGVVDNISWADMQELLLTSSYMDNVLALARPKEQKNSNGKSVLSVFNNNVKLSGYYNSSILECPSLEDCFYSVKEGKADFTFGNIYAVDYLRAKARYRDFDVSAVSESGGEFCFAMANTDDLTLYHIMNKAVKGISSETVEEAVANATANRKTEFSLIGYIYDHTLGVIIMVFGIACFMALVFIHFMRKSTAMEKEVSEKYMILEQRYKTVMNITGDYMFEYYPSEDKVHFSKSFAKKSGMQMECRNFRKFRVFENQMHPEDVPVYEAFFNGLLKKEFRDKCIGIRVANEKQEYEKNYIYAYSIDGQDGKTGYILGRFFDENTKIMENKRAPGFRGIYSYMEIKDMIMHILEQSEQREKHVMILISVHDYEEGESYKEKDPLLRATECIQLCVRETDIIGRSGDEQLLLFMTRIQSREQIENKTDKIKRLLREEFYSDSVKIMVGYSVYPLQGGNYEELYEKAVYDMSS